MPARRARGSGASGESSSQGGVSRATPIASAPPWRVLSPASPTRCSASSADHGSRLRGARGAPGRRHPRGSAPTRSRFRCALPARAVPALGGRGRLERATRREGTRRGSPRDAQRSRKAGAAIPRGEFGLCDPRRSQTTTGASVRLTSVAHTHPYSPRLRAQREYERRRVSGPRKPAADGQCRRGALAAAESRWDSVGRRIPGSEDPGVTTPIASAPP